MASKRGPGRPKNPVSREKLLNAAGMAFAERGHAGASMSDIAGRAGIQKASLFHHFSTKDALYSEVLSSHLSTFAGLIEEARAGEGGFLERLDGLSVAVADYCAAKPQTARLVLREFIDEGPFAQGVGKGMVATMLRAGVELVDQGVAAGVIPAQPGGHAVMSIVGLQLIFYAAVEVSADLTGADPFDPDAARARREAVVRQVRGVVGAPPP
jgi:AcrR family transcriptional regulator